MACRAGAHETAQCNGGSCEVSCVGVWRECNGEPGDGCEQDVSADQQNCGSCGAACAAGDHCITGRCLAERAENLPASRPIAPISHLVTGRVRPTFRWELPDWSIAIGALLEICADRACARLLQSVNATGTEATLPADLPAGVVFWRLTTRTSTAVGPNVSPTWVLYVEPETCPLNSFYVRTGDYDGDGVLDTFRVDGRTIAFDYSTGIPSTSRSLPAGSCVYDNGSLSCTHWDDLAGVELGDISGDGYEDFAQIVTRYWDVGTYHTHPREWVSWLGGPLGIDGVGAFSGTAGDLETGIPAGTGPRAVGDVDRDGYGDIVSNENSGFSGPFNSVVTHSGTWRIPAFDGRSQFWFVDVNGDAVADAITTPDAAESSFEGPQLALGDASGQRFGESMPLPRCVSSVVPPNDVWLEPSRDVNCDGMGDIAVRYGNEAPHSGDVRFVLLGGPDGLSSARCMPLPPTP